MKFILKNKWLFYLLQWTWGILMNLLGVLIAIGSLITGHKPKRFNHYVYFNVGKNWGGFESGMLFFTDSSDNLDTKQHESGHGLQNIILGPLMPFVVSIPSAIRYWLRECKTIKGKYIYTSVLSAILLIISAVLMALGGLVIWLFPIGLVLALYTLIIATWLFVREIPKYKSGKYVYYDSIWFEGQATNWGKKYFPQ